MNNKNKSLFKDQLHEIENQNNNSYIFSIKNLDKDYIQFLFNTYFIKYWLEYFYDSEPEYDDEEFKMHMDYLYQNKQIETGGTSVFYTFLNLKDIQEEQENFKFSEGNYTLEELKNAHLNIEKQRKEFEEQRLTFNNWVELHENGNWEATQEEVKKYGLDVILELFNSYKKDRWAIAENDNEINIYFYGRDIKPKCDYLFTFEK